MSNRKEIPHMLRLKQILFWQSCGTNLCSKLGFLFSRCWGLCQWIGDERVSTVLALNPSFCSMRRISEHSLSPWTYERLSKWFDSKWFEPRSISSSYCVTVRVSVVLKRTAVGDWRFDNLSRSHFHSQVNSVFSVNDVISLVRWKWLVS